MVMNVRILQKIRRIDNNIEENGPVWKFAVVFSCDKFFSGKQDTFICLPHLLPSVQI